MLFRPSPSSPMRRTEVSWANSTRERSAYATTTVPSLVWISLPGKIFWPGTALVIESPTSRAHVARQVSEDGEGIRSFGGRGHRSEHPGGGQGQEQAGGAGPCPPRPAPRTKRQRLGPGQLPARAFGHQLGEHDVLVGGFPEAPPGFGRPLQFGRTGRAPPHRRGGPPRSRRADGLGGLHPRSTVPPSPGGGGCIPEGTCGRGKGRRSRH